MGGFEKKVKRVGDGEGCKNGKWYGNVGIKLVREEEYGGEGGVDEMELWVRYENENMGKWVWC